MAVENAYFITGCVACHTDRDTFVCDHYGIDYHPDRCLHSMIGSAKLASSGCLKTTIDALSANLFRTPEDKTSIWRYGDNLAETDRSLRTRSPPSRCASNLGRNHPALTEFLVETLLGCVATDQLTTFLSLTFHSDRPRTLSKSSAISMIPSMSLFSCL